MKAPRIAVWNKDRVVVAIATGVWVINIAFLIQGNSPLLRPLSACNPLQRFVPGTARVNRLFQLYFYLLSLPLLQLRAKRLPQQENCMVPNSESGKLNIIVTLITDVILLLLMLVGLLRIRRYGGGTSCLAHLMWKQVCFSAAIVFFRH